MQYRKGSLVLGRFADIPIKVHWSFGLLLLFITYYIAEHELSAIEGVWFFSLVLLMFCFVIMHEYGHALTARRYGVATKDIIISPIGGVARLTHIPKKALHELYIAFAGPAVNLVFLILFGAILLIAGKPLLPTSEVINPLTHWSDYIGILFSINAALVAFNLIPAFPMDGGRILRALLTMGLKNHQKATMIASYVGQVLAVIFVIGGAYFDHYMLMFIGIFVFLTARAERRFIVRENKLNEIIALDLLKSQERNLSILSVNENGDLISHDRYGYVSYNIPINKLFEVMKSQGWLSVIVRDENKKEIGVIDRPLLLSYINKVS
jgi:Zn-dependent protease